MKAVSYKRIFAYLIDMLVVTFIGVLIGYFIPVTEGYEKASEEFTSFMKQYQDGKLGEDDLDKLNDINYKINKESIASNIILVVIYIGYFVILPYYSNGQTLGKKVMKIKIASDTDKKLSMNNYLIRALIIDSILSTIISVVLILVLNKESFMTINELVTNFFMYLYIIILIMILFKKDGRGVHDILSKTKVVSVSDNDKENIEDAVVLEETADVKEIKEPKKASSKLESNKTTTKETSSKKEKNIKNNSKTSKTAKTTSKKNQKRTD